MVMKYRYCWLLLTIVSISCQDSATILTPEINQLAKFDSLMVFFMSENDIDAGALSIMKNSQVVYEKAFGWKDSEHTQILPQNAMMRLASVSKPITAAAIRKLIGAGKLDLTAPAFDLDGSGIGVLEINPFPVLGDTLFKRITVEDLLLHSGGWDRESDKDWVFHEIEIASELDVSSPPTQAQMISFLLGKELQFSPGSNHVYSNVGYLVLGKIVEEVSGQDYIDYIHEAVLGPIGINRSDVIQGRSFRQDRNYREPWYDAGFKGSNVFDVTGPPVLFSDGGWNHEGAVAYMGLVATSTSIVEFLDHYFVWGEGIGKVKSNAYGTGWRYHTGSLPGTQALAMQRDNGINYVTLFNKRPGGGDSYNMQIKQKIDEIIGLGVLN